MQAISKHHDYSIINFFFISEKVEQEGEKQKNLYISETKVAF